MDKVKKTAEVVEKVVEESAEVVNESVQKVDKAKAISTGAAIVSWLTAGKIEKNTVIALAGIVFGLSGNMGPWEKASVEALNELEQRIEVSDSTQAANQAAIDRAAQWFDVQSEYEELED